MKKQAVFWDFDGTLTYAERLWSRSIYASLLECVSAVPFSYEEMRPHMSELYPWSHPERDWRRLTGGLFWDYMRGVIGGRLMCLGIGAGAAKEAAARVRGHILQPGAYTLYPDVHDVLAACMDLGFQNILISNNYPELGWMMRELGLSAYFAGYAVSACAGFDKPRAELFLYARRLAGNPARCLMVGDNPEADAKGAAQCGIPSFLVHQTEGGIDSTPRLTDVLALLAP